MGQTIEQKKLASQGLRKCRLCNKIKKSDENFHVKRYFYNEDGSVKYKTRDSRCKLCMKDYTRSCMIKSTESYCKYVINPIRHRAKKINMPFDLTKEDLIDAWNKQNGKCFYSNVKLDLSLSTESRNSPHRLFPSIDRQIPTLGYIRGNIVWCTYVVNRMKSDLSHEEFVDFCSIVINKFKK